MIANVVTVRCRGDRGVHVRALGLLLVLVELGRGEVFGLGLHCLRFVVCEAIPDRLPKLRVETLGLEVARRLHN